MRWRENSNSCPFSDANNDGGLGADAGGGGAQQERTSALVRKMSVMPPPAAASSAAEGDEAEEDDGVAIESVREVVAKQNSKVRRERERKRDGTDCCAELLTIVDHLVD